MFRRLTLCASALACALVLPALASAGTVSGTVYLDYNSNGQKDVGSFVSGSSVTATDIPVAGVDVTAYDYAGDAVGTATSAEDGTYTLTTTASGLVRVQFTPPTDGTQPSFFGPQDGTTVQFVEVGSSGVDFGIVDSTQYCQDNPRIVTCMQPAFNMVTAQPARAGAISFPASFGGAQSFDRRGIVDGQSAETATIAAGVDTESPAVNLGATFGVGVDRGGNAYFGTYVKRHSPYGPEGGVNAVYRVNLATGTASTFAILGSASLPAHNAAAPDGYPDYSADGIRSATEGTTYYSDVYTQVGRAGLGDVDVSPDGSTLYAVEMTEGAPKFWTVSLADPTVKTSVAIPNPAPGTSFDGVPCVGTFHPMGIGVRGSRVLVGGVCGGTETRWVDPVTGRTEAAAFILELNAGRTAFATIAATRLDFNKGSAYLGENLVSWNYGSGGQTTGLWRNWSDAAPTWSPSRPWYPSWPIPMLSNIEIMDDGDLVIGLRDRYQDQVKVSAVSYEWSGTGAVTQSYNAVGAGHLLRMCALGDGYVRESAATCGDTAGAGLVAGENSLLGLASSAQRDASPAYYASGWWNSDYDGFDTPVDCSGYSCALHPYTATGGMTSMPGNTTLWTTAYDINIYYQQGVRALGPCASRAADVGTCGPDATADGAMIGGQALSTDTTSSDPFAYRKGNGLGDLELVCDAAPLEIGNRIWLDSNKNGVQDVGEPVVPGVTVHLYDPEMTLLGTALTDADGTYYFSSLSTAPDVGDGSNVGGGLAAGSDFIVRVDDPDDYAEGGPLFGFTLTDDNVESPDGAANSKATYVDDYPEITVDARAAGENDHTFDVGFVTDVLVGMGNYTWQDLNRNGLQDEGEPALGGVEVQLLDASGAIAVDADGDPVAPATTDSEGRYFVGNLIPGTYQAQFTLPSGYTFTTANVGPSGTDSKAVATEADPLVGVTLPFEIGPSAGGDTTEYPEPGAAFANLTIDAGVVTGGSSSAVVGMGDYTWIDANRNGLQDAGEAPLPGVVVQLLNPDGSVAKDAQGTPVASVTTDAQGYYFVGNLLPGSYAASFTIPNGYGFTTPNVGPSTLDSNPVPTAANPLVGVTPAFQIAGSATGDTTVVTKPNASFANLTIDAGVVPLVAVGNYTWFDTNDNGTQDGAEKPMPGVRVTLLTTGGKVANNAYDQPVTTAVTDKKGYYVFDALNPGQYVVRFETPRRYTYTVDGRGTSKNGSNPKVSARNPRIGTTKPFWVYGEVKGDTVANTNPKVRAAFVNPTIDAGVVPQCTKFTIDKTLLYRGESTTLTVTAKLNGRIAVGKRVTLKGLGISLSGVTNKRGQAVFSVEATKAGRLLVSSPDALPGCTPSAITIAKDAFPITG